MPPNIWNDWLGHGGEIKSVLEGLCLFTMSPVQEIGL